MFEWNRGAVFMTVVLCCYQFSVSTGDVSTTLSVLPEKIPNTYREVSQFLKAISRPTARMAVFDLSSSTPFCGNATIPEGKLDEIETECNRWEEQELDLLLMYMDLIAVGMDENLAKKFYQEIRCLSRRHVRFIPHLRSWEVCFKYDFSELVGSLLGRYVKEDLNLVDSNPSLETSTRFSTYSWSRGPFLLNLFRDGRAFRIYSASHRKAETSCCASCLYSHYFVNLESGQCTRNPFGRHCCHNACKSLGRLKVGASSSTSFCCKRCRPMPCRR